MFRNKLKLINNTGSPVLATLVASFLIRAFLDKELVLEDLKLLENFFIFDKFIDSFIFI